MHKRIVICSTSYADYDRRIQRVIAVLLDMQYQVTWLSRGTYKHPKVIHTAINTWFSSGILFYLEFNIRLILKLLLKQKELVYAVDLDTLLAGYLGRKKAALIFDSHEYFTEVPELLNKPIKKQIWAALAKWIIPKTSVCITVNQSLADIFKTLYKKQFEVVRNVPILKKDDARPNGNNKTLIYQGALNTGRGIELAIDAIKQLPDYRLIIAGEGDLSKELRLKVKELKLTDRVEFKGWVKPSDLHHLSKQASIGLNMLEPLSLNYTYSLANKFFDYIQAGIPSINMAFPEYLHITKDHDVAVLTEAYTTEALIQTIKQLEDSQLYALKTQACLSAKKHFHWSLEKAKLLNLLQSV